MHNQKKETKHRAGAVILDPSYKYILVVKGHLSEKWGPPKGHVHHGEPSLHGAMREVGEEVGLRFVFKDDINLLPRVTADKSRLYLITVPMTAQTHIHDKNEIKNIVWLQFTGDPPLKSTKMLTQLFRKRKEIIHKMRLNAHNYDLDTVPKNRYHLNNALAETVRQLKTVFNMNELHSAICDQKN